MSPEAARWALDDDDEGKTPHDVAGTLALVRRLAMKRFPRERATLKIFFEELEDRLTGKPREGQVASALPAGSFAELLTRLEELLEALLVGQVHGITPR